jgi:hypothetical protein
MVWLVREGRKSNDEWEAESRIQKPEARRKEDPKRFSAFSF